MASSKTHSTSLRMITNMSRQQFQGGKTADRPTITCLLERGCEIQMVMISTTSRITAGRYSSVSVMQTDFCYSLATLLGLEPKVILTSIRSSSSVLLVPDSDSGRFGIFAKIIRDMPDRSLGQEGRMEGTNDVKMTLGSRPSSVASW